MRKYIITYSQPSEDLADGQTIENDLKALKNGDLTIDDLQSLVECGDITVEYEVIDVD